jgi:hypothetical protein
MQVDHHHAERQIGEVDEGDQPEVHEQQAEPEELAQAGHQRQRQEEQLQPQRGPGEKQVERLGQGEQG